MTTTFKFHYESREQLLEDYLEYMPKKSSALYIRHQRRTAHSVDKSMCLFPNALKEHDMVEWCFFLPHKKKLLENKDRDIEE